MKMFLDCWCSFYELYENIITNKQTKTLPPSVFIYEKSPFNFPLALGTDLPSAGH